jgi:hypothetical protein
MEAAEFVQCVEEKGLHTVHQELAMGGEPFWTNDPSVPEDPHEAAANADLEATAAGTAAAYLTGARAGGSTRLGDDLRVGLGNHGMKEIEALIFDPEYEAELEEKMVSWEDSAEYSAAQPKFLPFLLKKYPRQADPEDDHGYLYSGGDGHKFFTRVRLAFQLSNTFSSPTPDDPNEGPAPRRAKDMADDEFVKRTLEATPLPQPGAVPHGVFS